MPRLDGQGENRSQAGVDGMMGAGRAMARLITAGVLLALVGVLVGLGSAAPGRTILPSLSAPAAVVIEAASFLALALEGVMLVLILRGLWPGLRGRRSPEHEPVVTPLPVSPWLRLGLTVLSILIMVGGWVILQLGRARPAPPSLGVGAILPPHARGWSGPLVSGEVTWSALGLAVLILAVGVTLFTYHLLRRRPQFGDGRERRLTVLMAAVDKGLEALDQELDPRRAVILAYAAMERVLANRGWPRRHWEAPFEYLERVRQEIGVGGVSVQRLTDLFEIARYSHHRVNEQMRTAALSELRSIRSGLEKEPSRG
jgi:hypothetical protein